MKVLRHDHNTERALEDGAVRASVESLLAVLEKAPVPYLKGKSEKQPEKCILQRVLNVYFEQELRESGWESQFRVTEAKNGASGMRSDFCKQVGDRLIAVEVELGNGASFFRNLIRFQHLNAQGRLALAISVELTAESARLTDSGLTSHEMDVQKLEVFRETSAKGIPILCLGLSHQNSVHIDFARSQFPNPKVFQGKGAMAAIGQVVEALRSGVSIKDVAPPSFNRAPLRAATAPAQGMLF
jgi:hypothetical protein